MRWSWASWGCPDELVVVDAVEVLVMSAPPGRSRRPRSGRCLGGRRRVVHCQRVPMSLMRAASLGVRWRCSSPSSCEDLGSVSVPVESEGGTWPRPPGQRPIPAGVWSTVSSAWSLRDWAGVLVSVASERFFLWLVGVRPGRGSRRNRRPRVGVSLGPRVVVSSLPSRSVTRSLSSSPACA